VQDYKENNCLHFKISRLFAEDFGHGFVCDGV